MIKIKNNGHNYSIKIDNENYTGKIQRISGERFLILDGVGHFGLDSAFFSAKTDDCQICSPEYTRRNNILATLHKEIFLRESRGRKFSLNDSLEE